MSRVLIVFFLSLSFFINAQSEFISIGYDFKNNYEESVLKNQLNAHLFSAPFLLYENTVIDSSRMFSVQKEFTQNWKRILFYDNLIHVNKDVELRIDPVLDFSYGKQISDINKTLFNNTRGFQLKINFNKKFYVFSDFRENQVIAQTFLSEYTDYREVFFGQGRVKPFKEAGYDFANASGYASYSPNSVLNFTFGNGKQFIGNGYRSFILSDNSHNYPSLKVRSLWFKSRLEWCVNYSSLVDLERMPFSISAEALFKRKEMVYQTFNYLVGDKLSVGVASMSLIKRYDDSLYSLPADIVNYLPIPFLTNVLERGKQSVISAFLGLNLSYKIKKQGLLYAQGVFDEQSKYAFQFGVKWYNIFKLKGLDIRLEYNEASPGIYQSTELRQNFINNSLPLSHSLGNDFKELICQIDYGYKKIGIHFQGQYYLAKVDVLTRYSTIFISESDVFNDTDKRVLNLYSNVFYRVNPFNNLKLFLGAGLRDGKNRGDIYFNFGVSTLLSNMYKAI